MTTPKFCAACGGALAAGGRFCPHCAAPVGAVAPGAAPAAAFPGPSRPATPVLPWAIAALAVVGAIAYSIRSRRLQPLPGELAGPGAGGPAAGPNIVLAPDISSMTADQRVDRLVARVVALDSAGKSDSVAFFAPMAVDAFAALEPLTPARRHDLARVLVAAGDLAGARKQLDALRAEAPRDANVKAIEQLIGSAAR